MVYSPDWSLIQGMLMDEQVELDLDDSWINELCRWAYRYDIPDLQYVEPEVDNNGVLLRECSEILLGLDVFGQLGGQGFEFS